MGKSNRFWVWRNLPAVSLVSVFGVLVAAPAIAQDHNTGLFGNIGGLRTMLGDYGITLGLNDSENLLGSLSGGVKQGATMQGVTTGTIDVDTGKAFGLQGGTFHISALQLHGQPLSASYLDNLQAANGNEGEDATRLWELWYDQQLGSKFDIKIGQQSIDNEFMGSSYSALFVNTMAGWPLVPSDDLYGGGPAYPLSSLGVRTQAELTDSTTILAGVFDDNPGGGAFDDDAQYLDRNGALFNLNTGALFIAELQYATKIGGLDGSYKIGGWYDTGFFPDQEFGTDGLSLANPASNGNPLMHHGNYSLYGVVDQTLWKSAGAQSVNVFARIMGAPDDQNLIDFSFNGGVTMTAPFPGRDNDQAGIDIGVGKVSSRASDLDRDLAVFSGSPYPIRGTETLIELTYQAQITNWLIMQPDLQYVFNPGGGVPDPNDTTQNLQNEFIAGLRAIVTF
jgi:porin